VHAFPALPTVGSIFESYLVMRFVIAVAVDVVHGVVSVTFFFLVLKEKRWGVKGGWVMWVVVLLNVWSVLRHLDSLLLFALCGAGVCGWYCQVACLLPP
jgi:ABC-type sugar transport system permease subunit